MKKTLVTAIVYAGRHKGRQFNVRYVQPENGGDWRAVVEFRTEGGALDSTCHDKHGDRAPCMTDALRLVDRVSAGWKPKACDCRKTTCKACSKRLKRSTPCRQLTKALKVFLG